MLYYIILWRRGGSRRGRGGSRRGRGSQRRRVGYALALVGEERAQPHLAALAALADVKQTPDRRLADGPRGRLDLLLVMHARCCPT